MRVPYTWLHDFIDSGLTADRLAELLTRSGIEVEEITALGAGFDGVVTTEVREVSRHPFADRLFVARVFDGKDEVTVVAGTDNMKVGDIVPLAVPGARLPGGVTISGTRLRGVESAGMLCSARELNLELDPALDGILVLDPGTPVGMPLAEALGLDDPILVLGLTPNRSDCLGLLGVAYEVAALTGREVQLPDLSLNTGPPLHTVPRISIADPLLCARYSGLVMTGVKVGPSPLWLQLRLLQAGVRPISNIVDVTNYVMWEWGQPLHAFDYHTLADKTIVVRRARPSETLVTLDGVERTLTDQMLVIADSVRPVALAGVMGGLDTEITDRTTVVLLESAHFDPVSIRRTGRQLGLCSEAQQRFEKGVDVNGCVQASRRAARLMELIGAARPDGTITDEYVNPSYPKKINLRPDRARQIIGLEISQKEMSSIFRRQGFTVEEGTQIHVTVPTRRADLQEEIDLIEEVARIHGYEKIDATLPAGAMTQGRRTKRQQVLKKTREIMVACGFAEVINYSFETPARHDRLLLARDDPKRAAIPVANPLSEEQGVMRTTLIGGILDTVAYNHNRNQHDLKLFELGAVYLPKQLPLEELPEERMTIGIVLTGVTTPEHWRHKPQAADFFDLKGVVETLLSRLGVSGVRFREADMTFLQPGQSAVVLAGDLELGWLGSVHPAVLEEYDIDKNALAAELDMERVLALANLNTVYMPLPKFPALLRDLAVVVPDGVSAEQVAQLIREAGGGLVDSVTLFDLYRGPQIPTGYHSLAFAVSYRDPARTLSDGDAAALHQKIEAALEERLGASLRR